MISPNAPSNKSLHRSRAPGACHQGCRFSSSFSFSARHGELKRWAAAREKDSTHEVFKQSISVSRRFCVGFGFRLKRVVAG
jgi:hypothetical protein